MFTKYIDFHNHSHRNDDQIVSVRSYMVDKFLQQPPAGQFCTVGIHPWQSGDDGLEVLLTRLELVVAEKNVVGIGEIGLDRLRGADLQTQVELFRKQVHLAERAQKPVVIHCVRSFSELMQLHKQLKPTTPWAIHNFMGNAQIAQALVKGGFYLSFCIAFSKNRKIADALRLTPPERIFFETDDFIPSVVDVYNAAAQLVSMELPLLKQQIAANFQTFFGATLQ